MLELITHCPISEESSVLVSIQIRVDMITIIEKKIEIGNYKE